MPRRRRVGRNRLIATSAHIPFTHLEAIENMGESPSRFIRQAVAEKLEREQGYEAAIERISAEIEDYERQLSGMQERREKLLDLRDEWKAGRLHERIRSAMVGEYLTHDYETLEALILTFKDFPDFDKLSKEEQLAIASEVWKEFNPIGVPGKMERDYV